MTTKKEIHSFVAAIFITASTMILPVFTYAQSQKTGYRVAPSKIDDPDFYSAEKGLGKEIKELYESMKVLRDVRLDMMPPDFLPVVDVIHQHIIEGSEIANKKSSFYSGPNGFFNGDGYTFAKKDLPTKLVKISFCFGFDPLVFTALVKQESHFYRFAKSPTNATGFTQQTTYGIREVNDQLGARGPQHHGDNAPDILAKYIQCYLGPQKDWANFWEDEWMSPQHKAYREYVRGSPKNTKTKKALSIQKKWLNADPDRNLIYGAALFKIYLGQFGSYAKALRQYNVSNADSYQKRIEKFYAKMERLFNHQRQNSGTSDEIYSEATKEKAKNIDVDHKFYSISTDTYVCEVPSDVLVAELDLSDLMSNDYTDAERKRQMFENINKQGYCKNRYIEI